MPMIDAYIPQGALHPERETALIDRLTKILVAAEGFDPQDPAVLAVSWIFVHHPAVYVAGAAAEAPRYKIVVTVPEGQLDEQARSDVIAQVTEAVMDAEDGACQRDPSRVWVFPVEIPDGHWGGVGRVMRLADILRRVTGGDAHSARLLAEERIARSRAERSPMPPSSMS